MQTVAIIGGAGFIGSYVTKIFLEENFQVRVSATDISNRKKYYHLRQFPNAENLQIIELDMMDIDSIQSFVSGCDIIVHAGTPFMLDVKDPIKELLDPTIKGTEHFLQAISRQEGIKKVIFIASVAAWNTSFPLMPESYVEGHIFSEQDTPYLNEQDHPYAQAKYYADQSVRKFLSDYPDLPFEIITISPVMVIGNSLSSRQDSTAVGLQHLFKNKLAPNPFIEMLYEKDVMFAMVDVSDVADAIFEAAIWNGLHGKNYLIATESYRVSDIARMLNKEAPLAEPCIVYCSDLAKKELGISFTPVRTVLNQFI